MTNYVELHARSAFSFLEGSSLPEELVEHSRQLDTPALAVLDHDNISGAARFHLHAEKHKLRAHIGAEITCADGHRYPLLAESRTGYQNLCRLITRMKLRSPKGEAAATEDDLSEFAEGLVCLTGGENGPLDFTPGCMERLIRIFSHQNIYAEIQRHYDRAEEARNQAIVDVARSYRLPLLATNGVTHATAAGRELQDVLACVRNKVTIDEAGRLLARNSERHLKDAREMGRLFADLPEAIANTVELSNRLRFTLADLGYQFPRYPVGEGETMNSFLRQRTDEGVRNRYRPYHERAHNQIERELKLIEKLDLAGYFLIVWDIVQFCRRNGILAQGRGSAANSAVCYALGITAVDPVAMDLLFERFLTEERGEWPDIDIDLPSGDQRERVIQYVYARYGRLGAAMTANMICYRGRSAVRDIGKVLGYGEEDLGRLSKLVGSWEWKDPADTAEKHFREAGFSPGDPLVSKFIELYSAAQTLPRHLGQHSGGMVICQGQLDSIVPLEPATMPGRVVIQWDKEDCADMGIIKVDLLGLGMLAVVSDCIDLIRDNYGEEVDLAHLPENDPLVYAALENADTIGMFQVESRAQMSCLPRMRPQNFYDIVVQVAIIRPGPIVGKMLNPYLRRRQGREPVEYPHPALKPVLERTLGVPLFQEQLLRMAMIVAGFSGGQAEELRRAFGFRRSEARMREIEVKLRAGMESRGIDRRAQELIIQSITSFATYGFPESHAASFALIAYASAFLKCRYLAAFTAAMLNNQPMGFYAPATLVKDAQHHGLHFSPVDVQRSEWLCTIKDEWRPEGPPQPRKLPHNLQEQSGAASQAASSRVRLGLNYIKGLREEAAQSIVRARTGRPFSSIQDFVDRVPQLRKDEIRMLAEAGALNFISGVHRRGALWEAELAMRPAGPLFEAITNEPQPAGPLAQMTPPQRLNADFRRTHLTIGPHPMSFHRQRLNELGIVPARALKEMRNGVLVKTAGAVICRQRPGTAKGLVFLSMEDETGVSNVVIMPDKFAEYRATVVGHGYLVIEGELQNIDGVVSVKADHVMPLRVAEREVPSHNFH